MNQTKNLFEEKAKEFDSTIPLIIPFYNKIFDILIESIPFQRETPIRILDIGCGTGTLALILKNQFPFSHITCVDFAENMIKIAKSKLEKFDNSIEFCTGDFNKYCAAEKYDLIVSCFALHHIPTDEEKIQTYQNIFNHLKENGVFFVADIVLGSNKHIDDLNSAKWKDFLYKNFTPNVIEKELLPVYQAGDNPSSLFKHFMWLKSAGFQEIEAIWKYFNFAVFGGKRLSAD